MSELLNEFQRLSQQAVAPVPEPTQNAPEDDTLLGHFQRLSRQAVQPPTPVPNTVEQSPPVPEGVTFDNLSQNQDFLTRARRFYGNRGQTFGETPEEVQRLIDHYTSDRVWRQDVNSVSMLREVDAAFRGGQQHNEDLKYLRDTWNNLPNMFQSGGRSPLEVVPQYLGAAIADPATYIGMGVGSRIATGLASRGVGPVVSNLAGQAIADAGISAGQNLAQQAASIGVGAQSEISPGQVALAGAAGAATGPALYAAGRGLGAAARGVGRMTIGGQSEVYLDELRRDGIDGLLRQMRQDMPGMSDVLGREDAAFRVMDRDGNVLREFDNGREARQFAQENNGLAMKIERDGLTRINPVSSLINSAVDHLTSIRRISQLAQTNAAHRGNPARELDAYMFATSIGQNSMQTAERVVAPSGGAQFRLIDGYMTAIEGSKGIAELVMPLAPVERGDIFRYILAKRFDDMEAGVGRQAGLNIGMNPQQRQQFRDFVRGMESNPERMARWRPILDNIQTYRKNHFDLMEDLGVFSPELRQTIEAANFWYAPIHRIVERTDVTRGEMADALGVGVARERRFARGVSDRAQAQIDQNAEYRAMFADPARNYAANIQASIAMGIRNKLLNQIVDDLESLPVGLRNAFGEVVGNERVGRTFSFENVANTIERQLENANVPAVERDAIMAGLENARVSGQQGALDFFTFFSSMAQRGDRFIPFYRNGQMRFLQVNNQDLLNSLAAFQRQGANWNFLADATQAFQYLITRSPDFVIGTSLPTDMVSAQNYSNLRNVSDGIPYWGGIDRLRQGFSEVRQRQSALYNEAIANGVLYSGLGTNAAADVNPVTKQFLARYGIETDNIFGLTDNQDRRLMQRIWSNVRGAAHRVKDGFDYVSETAEAAPRMGEFLMQRQAGETNARAAFNAVENNIDFRRRPANAAWGEYLRVVPFLRAGNNVLYRLARSMEFGSGDFFDRASAGARNMDNLVRQAKIAATVALPVVFLALLNMDNPHFQGLQEEDRTMFHHVWIGGQHYRLRKTEDMALFSNGIQEMIVALRRDNLPAYEALRQSVLGVAASAIPAGLRSPDPTSIGLNMLPFGVKTGAGLALNRQFGDRPITPPGMDNRPRTEQFQEGSTSPIAIAFARMMPFGSPLQWEFVARDTLGPIWQYFGQDAARLFDPAAISRGVGDIPVARRFVRDAIQDMQSSDWGTTFYDLREQAKAARDLVERPVQETLGRDNTQGQANRGRLDARQRLLADLSPRFEETARRISTMRNDMLISYNRLANGRLPTEEAKEAERQRIRQAQIMIYMEQYALAKDATMRLQANRY